MGIYYLTRLLRIIDSVFICFLFFNCRLLGNSIFVMCLKICLKNYVFGKIFLELSRLNDDKYDMLFVFYVLFLKKNLNLNGILFECFMCDVK